MTSKDVKNPVTIWALIATLMTIALGAKALLGIPSCNEIAMAADVKEIDTRLNTLISSVNSLTVSVAELTINVQHLDERTKTCE